MKLICSRAELVEALSKVSRAAAPKSPMKVIEGVLLRANDKGLYMCCYDLELGISKTIPASVSEHGEVVLPLKLCEYARRMADKNISIECNEKYAVHISSGLASFDIIGMPATDFPDLPDIEAQHTVRLTESKLHSMINHTSYAICTKQDMPVYYTGELFELSDGYINLVALDGYRIAVRNEPIEDSGEYKFIVPGKTLNELNKLLSDSDDEVEMTTAPKHIIISVNGYSFISRLMSGEFMNYRAAMSNAGNRVIRVKTSAFISALERMSLIITEAERSPVCCLFQKDRISFLCETKTSRAVDNIDCVSNMEKEVEMGFNNRYFLEALRAVDTDEVKLLIHDDPHKPLQMIPPEEENFRFMLMPVLLRPGIFENEKGELSAQSPEDGDENPSNEESDEQAADFGLGYED